MDKFADEVAPRGRATVPDGVKAELLQRTKNLLQSALPLGLGGRRRERGEERFCCSKIGRFFYARFMTGSWKVAGAHDMLVSA